MVSKAVPVDPFDLVIFGGTGDLARRKILPALYRRFMAGQTCNGCRIIGAARSERSDEDYRAMVRDAITGHLSGDKWDAGSLSAFLETVSYLQVDALGDDGWSDLRDKMRPDVIRVFYFSVAPRLFGPLAEQLHKFDIANEQSRVVVEKPFGRDLESAKALNKVLDDNFHEDHIFRIDHYLGKETVQNLMAIRFGNMLFEPLWNAQYVDHIQITVAEEVGVQGRGDYYDRAGAMRDMVQNHMMQLLCLIAMEPPSRYDPDAVRDEKLKVIRALDPMLPQDVVRGQYLGSVERSSYLQDVGKTKTATESFIAMKCGLSNWRWKGTPFYLRTGKRLRARASEIAVIFKDPPHSIFGLQHHASNNLIIRLQPDEGITMQVTIKEPGPGGMRLMDVPLDMSFAEALGPDGGDLPDAYERLIIDVIRGHQTLFMRGDEVEAAWAWTDPIISEWEEHGDTPQLYDSGSTGPEESFMLMHRDGRRWREIR